MRSCALVAAGSICYYFVIALPRIANAHFEFEKQKYNDQQKAEEARQQQERDDKLDRSLAEDQKKTDRLLDASACDADAEKQYWNYIKLNGEPTPGKKGVWTSPQHIWTSAAENKKTSISECMAQFGHGR